MSEGSEPGRFYVTSAIPYVNDAPHIGHAYELTICDALARWHRLVGDDVYFVTGTDEHGTKLERTAQENGITPQEQVDRTSARFLDAWKRLGISNDDFVRTTEERHHRAVQELLSKVHANGFVELRRYEGLYCVRCEAYYTEDELDEGLLCKVHGTPAETLSEDNYFFKLSEFQGRLEAWIEQDPSPVQPEQWRNEVLGLLRQGLRDVSITRTSTSWGVRVPWDEDHVFYVWYDALINYATGIGYGTDRGRFEQWWPHANHVIGKDITRFHCVYWPAMLLAAGEEPPPHVWVHGWLLVGGEKMSKTKTNQISPDDLVEPFGVDPTRYLLLRTVPFGPDGDVSYEGFVDRYNSDLANNFGNLLSRVSTVVAKKCGGVGPAPRPDSPLAAVAADTVAAAAAAWAAVAPSDALDATWRLIREANAHLEANEPWKAEPGPAVDAVLGDALEVLRLVSLLASPAMPEACGEVWRRIGLPGRPDELRLADAAVWGGYPGGLPVEKGTPLFPRIQSA